MFGLVGKEIVFIVVLFMVYFTVIRGNWTNCFLQTSPCCSIVSMRWREKLLISVPAGTIWLSP